MAHEPGSALLGIKLELEVYTKPTWAHSQEARALLAVGPTARGCWPHPPGLILKGPGGLLAVVTTASTSKELLANDSLLRAVAPQRSLGFNKSG